MGWFKQDADQNSDNAGVTLSGDEQDKLLHIELENTRATIRELEAEQARLKLESQKSEARAVGAEAQLKFLMDQKLRPERQRCLALIHLGDEHHAPLAVVNKAILDGTSVGEFAVQLLRGGGDG